MTERTGEPWASHKARIESDLKTLRADETSHKRAAERDIRPADFEQTLWDKARGQDDEAEAAQKTLERISAKRG